MDQMSLRIAEASLTHLKLLPPQLMSSKASDSGNEGF